MALLFLAGVMNLYWIAGLSLLVLLEKASTVGRQLGFGLGVLLLVWALWRLGPDAAGAIPQVRAAYAGASAEEKRWLLRLLAAMGTAAAPARDVPVLARAGVDYLVIVVFAVRTAHRTPDPR